MRCITNIGEKKIMEIIEKCKKNQVNISELPVVRNRNELKIPLKNYNVIIIFAICAIAYIYNSELFFDGHCSIVMPDSITKALRRPQSCDFCRNVKKVVRLENVTPDEFEENYAYEGTPVIITDAMKNWTAIQKFDFWYFKSLYDNIAQSKKKWNCQFFPYKTEFTSLHEALSIPTARVNYEQGTEPWYFGWSNCNREVAEILRKHYGRPYFLPRTSENNAIDWIFMGGPGLGAHLHVDNVHLPSWQAQVKGTKEWTLAPPPECLYECTSFKATVWAGEISKYISLSE